MRRLACCLLAALLPLSLARPQPAPTPEALLEKARWDDAFSIFEVAIFVIFIVAVIFLILGEVASRPELARVTVTAAEG